MTYSKESGQTVLVHRSTSFLRRFGAVLGGLCLLATSCSSSPEASEGANAGDAAASTEAPRQVAPDGSSPGNGEDQTASGPTAPAPMVVIDAFGSIRTVPSEPAAADEEQQTAPAALIEANAVVATLGCTTSTGCDPTDLAAWAENQIDVVNLASSSAAIDGVDVLGEHATALLATGVSSVGYGETLDAALEPTILPSTDRPVAVFGISLATDIEPALVATANTPGIAAGPDALEGLLERITNSRAAGQSTILMVDWGRIDDRAPTDAEIDQLEPFIALGTDAIVGHGSDFLQRFERVDRTAVAFNLGNALTTSTDPLRRDTAVLRLQLDDIGDVACLLPAEASNVGVEFDDPTAGACPR